MALTDETISWIGSIDAATALQDIACLVDLDDPAARVAAQLPPSAEDRLRAAAYGDAARGRFFSRRAVMRHLLAARLGCSVEVVVIGVDESGAPCLAAPVTRSPHFLSISARAAFAAFAVASRPVGIDIEILGEPEPVPQDALHPNEAARLGALGESERHKAFLEIWTVKEAYLKALRVGLTREPGEVEIVFGTDGRACIVEGGASVTARVSVREFRERAATTILAACVLL
jgi:phosphopantetheinyl transferase